MKFPEELTDVSNETIAVGMIYNNSQLLDKYHDKIIVNYDFSDDNLKLVYSLLVTTYLTHEQINDTTINVEVYKLDEDDRNTFNMFGGLKTIHRLSALADKSTIKFEKVYENLKTYNTLRALHSKGIDVLRYIDKLKTRTSNEILKSYELLLTKIGTHIKNLSDPKNLGDGLRTYYEKIKEEPDIGEPICWPIINRHIRGLRKRTLVGIGMHTNKGKTRLITRMLTDFSVENNNKSLVISTEMTDEEMKLQLLTSVANNVFSKKYKQTIREDKIALGELNDTQRLMLEEAINYIEEKCNIDFICTNVYDFNTLKMLIKQHVLKGVKTVVIDVFKPYRFENSQGLSEWQQYSLSAEKLKQMAIELDITIIFTFQLTPSSLETGTLDINSIALGTHISFVLDTVILARELTGQEKQKLKYRISQPDHPFNNEVCDFERKKDYLMVKIIKNRAGIANFEVVLTADRGHVLFDELGFLVKYFDKKEEKKDA